MTETSPKTQSLVLYKARPARVLAIGDKIDIEVEAGETKRVRPKDLALLHPGPLASLSELRDCPGDVESAWELLAGTTTSLAELGELIYGDFTPAIAWATWQLVAEGLYFRGPPWRIEVRTPELVAEERAAREAKAAAEREWKAFLERMQAGTMAEVDRGRLSEVEQLALGRRETSRILQTLGHQESPEQAHRFLVRIGYWEENFNPYPGRTGLPLETPSFPLPDLPPESRQDLTQLTALAIDDEGNEDPDDAIGWDGERLWVHIADVAALVPPDSPADLEARSRGANLYLPEGVVTMLPPVATQRLGLGLTEISPALSLGLRLGSEGELLDAELMLSWIRVQRLTYAQVNESLHEEPFRSLFQRTQAYRARRQARGSAVIELPEVSVRVKQGQVIVRPLPRLDSRDMVTDTMLMAGEAIARFARERAIPIPFAAQPPPDSLKQPQTMAEMFAYRKQFKPTRLNTQGEPHAGLGLELYTRATSPLRRYSDLLVHQQLRAHLRGEPWLDAETIANRCAIAETASGQVRRTERLSNQHWKMVYLTQNPGWRGKGVLVDVDDTKGLFLLPALAMEARVRLRAPEVLNAERLLAVREVDIPELTAWFHVRN